MRNTQTCPKCKSRKLFVISPVSQTEPGSPNAYPMSVTSGDVPPAKSTFFGKDHEHVTAGTFEACVCALCGFTEWYARGANEVLARMALHPATGVLFIDGDAPAGPKR